MSDRISEDMSEDVSGGMSEDMSDRMSEACQIEFQKYVIIMSVVMSDWQKVW